MTDGTFFTTYFCMCDVSVAWREGQGLITEVTSSMGKVRACWGFSRMRNGNLTRPAFTVDEGLITNSDSINSLATVCCGFPNITPGRSASVSETAGGRITGSPEKWPHSAFRFEQHAITPEWSANRKLSRNGLRGDLWMMSAKPTSRPRRQESVPGITSA